MRDQSNDPARDDRPYAHLPDDTLVTAFMALLVPYEQDDRRVPMVAGISDAAAIQTRFLFFEIASRLAPRRTGSGGCRLDRVRPRRCSTQRVDPWDGFLADHPELDDGGRLSAISREPDRAMLAKVRAAYLGWIADRTLEHAEEFLAAVTAFDAAHEVRSEWWQLPFPRSATGMIGRELRNAERVLRPSRDD